MIINNYIKSCSVSRGIGNNQRSFVGHLEQLGILGRKKTMQKSALLGLTAHILGKVMGVWGLKLRLDWTLIPKEKLWDNNNNISNNANNLYWLRTGLFCGTLQISQLY